MPEKGSTAGASHVQHLPQLRVELLQDPHYVQSVLQVRLRAGKCARGPRLRHLDRVGAVRMLGPGVGHAMDRRGVALRGSPDRGWKL